MNQSVVVALMAIGMFVSTFLIGFLPTKFKTSQKWMNIIAIYGAGLLVGAAIIIILPEGMLVLFESMISPEIIGELGLDTHATHEGDANTTTPTTTASNVAP
jgi:zinc transporter 9